VERPVEGSLPVLPWGATLDCRIDSVSAAPRDLGDATVFLEDRRELNPGETATARILPGRPSRWREVSIGNEIELLRDHQPVAVASVTQILEAPTEARYSPSHRTATYKRWSARLNRSMNDQSYREEWRGEQCGLCQFWIPMAGWWGLDWGGCSNERRRSTAQRGTSTMDVMSTEKPPSGTDRWSSQRRISLSRPSQPGCATAPTGSRGCGRIGTHRPREARPPSRARAARTAVIPSTG
jgi:hypothetical protein